MPGKLTRKEIRQDRIRTVLQDVYDWLARRTAYLGAAVGLFALIVLGSYGWQVYQGGAEKERQAKLAEALEIYHAPLEGEDEPEPGHEGHDHSANPHSKYRFATAEEREQKALESFEALAEESPNRRAGQYARYYQAILLQRLGRHDEAADVLRALEEDVQQPELSNLVRNRMAFLLLNQGKRDEAIEIWAKILESPAPNFPRDQLLAQLGVAAERAGKQQAALDYYRQLQAEFPTSPQTRDLERRIDYLEAVLEPEQPPAEAPPPQEPSG